MNKQLLKDIIIDQSAIDMPEGVIPRSVLPAVSAYTHSSQIVIISGIRRSGKSVLMRLLQQSIDTADYYCNFDDDRLCQFTVNDFQVLLETFIELFGVQHHFFFGILQLLIFA